MKFKLLFAAFNLIILTSFAQQKYPWAEMAKQNNADFYNIVSETEAFYAENPDMKGEEGSTYKKYLRWKTFWENRIQKNDTLSSDFSMFRYANYQYLKNGTSKSDGSLESNWQMKGPNNFSTQNLGIIVSLAINPSNNDIIYAGTNSSGLWKTFDGGISWTNITDQLNVSSFGVECIAMDPNNSDIIYIAVGTGYKRANGLGVFKSIDAGNTWTQTGLAFEPHEKKFASKIIINPSNSNILYSLVNDKIYRSTDAANNWSIIFEDKLTHWEPSWGIVKKRLRDIELHPNNSDILFVSSDGLESYGVSPTEYYPSELWKTENASASNPSWSNISITSNYVKNMVIAT